MTERNSENENLAVAIAPGNFTEVKQILEYLSKMINIEIKIKEPEEFPPHFIEGRVAEITLGANSTRVGSDNSTPQREGGRDPSKKTLGFIGEIHPKILKNWKIKMPVAVFEISLEEVFGRLI